MSTSRQRVLSATLSNVNPFSNRACTPGKLVHLNLGSRFSRRSRDSGRERSSRFRLCKEKEKTGTHGHVKEHQDHTQYLTTLEMSLRAIENSASKSDSRRLTAVQNICATRVEGVGLNSTEW